MRESLAGLAWIERHVAGRTQWLVRWSGTWRRYALVGGHVEGDESFRDCTLREIHEELGLTPTADFHLSDQPLAELDFEEFSESAQEQTRYRFAVFGVALDSANAQDVAVQQIELRWVTRDEIERGTTTDGRPIGSQVQRVWQAMQSGDSQSMASKPLVEEYDFFVSYARADNVGGWVERFLEALVEEHRQFTGGRPPKFFFDRADISNFADWESQIFHKGLTKSRLFVAFLSPAYFASAVCRREWQAWIDQEIATHILSSGAAPIYFVEVPGLVSKPMLTEHEVAQKVGELCKISTPLDQFTADVSPVVQEFRRRQLVAWVRDQAVQPFFHSGVVDLQQEDLRRVLRRLAEDLDTRSEEARRAIESANTVPAYNKKFTGRLDELLELRRMLKDDRTGVVCGVAGLGGIGKSELAFTYAHAFASVYPGGRFYIGCDGQTDLRQALLQLGDFLDFHARITDDERKTLATYFPAVLRCLTRRLAEKGHVLLILDNVTDPALVRSDQTDAVTVLGPKLHLLATTRLLPSQSQGWLTLGELRSEDALALLEKHRPFADVSEQEAGREIVRKLGGFALAVELVAAGLAAHPSARYAEIAAELRLDDLDHLAEDQDVKLRQHNHEKRLQAVLLPTLSQLTPAERRVLEYASLLAPDHVPYPWLRELTIADFPELAQRNRWGDPWEELCRKLERLALFTRADGEGHRLRLVRMHRLVQELIRRDLRPFVLNYRQLRVTRLIEQRDRVLQQTTRWQDARWELEPLDALADLWAETAHIKASWLCSQTATRWHKLAEWARAEPLICCALSIDEQSYGAEHPKVATRLNNLAALLQATNRLAEAESLIRRALVIDEKSHKPEHPNIARDLRTLASLLRETNRMAEAEPLIRRALVIDERSFGPQHPNVANSLNNLVLLLWRTKRLAEAEPLMRRAMAIDELTYGVEHPNVARDLTNLATLLQDMNRLTEAEPLLHRALAIRETSYGAEHPDVANSLNNLGTLLQDTNRLTDAELMMRRALAIVEQTNGAEHPNVAICLTNLAQLLQATNRLVEAEPLMRRALAIDEKSYGAEHPKVAHGFNHLAKLLWQLGQPIEAEPLSRRAIAIFEHALGEDHPDVGSARSVLTRVLRATDRDSDAVVEITRAVKIFARHERHSGQEHPNTKTVLNNFRETLCATSLSDHEIERRLAEIWDSPDSLKE